MSGRPKPRQAEQILEVDLHGYAPATTEGLVLSICREAWEMGAGALCIIHGHGRERRLHGIFANTNTGPLGMAVRAALRSSPEVTQWAVRSSLNVDDWGATTIRLRPNPAPSRTSLSALPPREFE